MGVPDASQPSGLFWATVIGAAVGVIAGTVIQYFLTLLLNRSARVRQKSALVQEMIYNRSLVMELSEEMERFRNAVNSKVFATYYGYFNIGKAIFLQVTSSVTSGVLYEWFDVDDIRHVQRIVSGLSAGSENWFNSEITRRRNILINAPEQFDYGELVRFMEFVAQHIRDQGSWIDKLIPKLRAAR